MILLLLTAHVHACEVPTTAPATLGPDGTAWVLHTSPAAVCLFRIDDRDDAVRAARWDAASPRAPILIAPLSNGSLLLVRAASDDGSGWPLAVRLDGVESSLPLTLPVLPLAIHADPIQPVATVVTADGRSWRVHAPSVERQ
jgi:hypothetical protein